MCYGLAQFQAKESTDIPEEVYHALLLEIKKNRIKNLATLENKHIRSYLKKLKYNKYYEHIPHILYRLNGLPPPVIKKETEEKIRSMFKQIQAPFIKVCPKDRKNFLSYNYVIYKFIELLGHDELKPYLNLLKSRDKLINQEAIWKKICAELNWEYIRSI